MDPTSFKEILVPQEKENYLDLVSGMISSKNPPTFFSLEERKVEDFA
jgi:hypothetical protein